MKIYPVMLAMVTSVCALARKVRKYDPDLARQMMRASTSVLLNGVEGWHSQGGNKVARYNTAMASARETRGCLDISVGCGYLSEAEVAADYDRLDHIVAVMWKLARARS